MKLLSFFSTAVLLAATVAYAANVQTVLSPLRNRVETSDYRATGQLVRVDASGNRVSYAVSVKGLWFAGALHTLVDINAPKGAAAQARQNERVRILLETRPDGRNSIRIFRPNEAGPAVLPFDKWEDSIDGASFSYEDLLEPEYFWPSQQIIKTAVFGGRPCDILKSTPGASDRTHYAEVQSWLDRATDYPVYTEKTMKQSGLVKEFTSFGLRKSGGVWAATQVEAKVRGRAGSTFLIIKRGSTRAHLSARDFRPEQISHFEDRP